jgi:hypothetical protein
VVLASVPAAAAPADEALVAALLDLARDREWRFGQVVSVGPSLPAWLTLAARVAAPLVTATGFDPAAHPLVCAIRPLPGDATWRRLTQAVADAGAGLVFVVEHPATPEAADRADVIGVLTDAGERQRCAPDAARALSEAQHPAARCAGRRLSPPA